MKSTTIAACAIATILLGIAPATAGAGDYGYVTVGGANQVRVFDPANDMALVRNIAVGTAPCDIIGVPARHRVYVSNEGDTPGSISIIDSDLLQVVNTVTVPDGDSLSDLSYCPVNDVIVVAGRRMSTGMAAVFLLNLDSETASLLGESAWSASAEGCAAVAVGGGKVYFSVPAGGAAGALAVYRCGTGTVDSLALPAGTANPVGMDRSPDDSVVYVGCASSSPLEQRVLRIDTATDAVTAIGVGGSTASYATYDVSFRRDSTAPLRAYVVGTTDGGTSVTLDEYDATAGTRLNSVPIAAVCSVVFHHLDGGEDAVYLGSGNPAVTAFARCEASTSPPGGAAMFAAAAAPEHFAFMPAPAQPLILGILPKGGPASGVTLRVEGQGFMPGAIVMMEGMSQPTIFVDSRTLLVNPSGLYSGDNSVQVINPNTTSASLQMFYTACTDTTLRSAPLPLPPISAGYAMRSLPRYASVGDLRAALAASMGPYNPAVYRVFFWRGGQYVELPQMGPGETDLSGESFWIVSRTGGQASVPGIDVSSNGSMRVMPLRPGWNMISLPFENVDGSPLQEDWSAISVTSDGAAWSDAAPANASPSILHPEPFEFVGGAYVKPTVLETGKGYFVLNRTGGFIYLLLDNGGQLLGKTSAPRYKTLSAADPLPPAPPGSLADGSSGHSGGGCGLLGAEALLALALCCAVRRRR